MKLELYSEQLKRLPADGKQIIGHISGHSIVVYQAFNSGIANYAIKHQRFGGPHYSFNRMSWIKPGFLWMMHRAGWAAKEHQQQILAITLPIEKFKLILSQATLSACDGQIYATQQEWKQELERTEVRLQWDPDHDPFGIKQNRRAIQLGLKGDILKLFATQWIEHIEDITPFVKQEFEKVKNNSIEKLMLPYEEVLSITEPELIHRLGIN